MKPIELGPNSPYRSTSKFDQTSADRSRNARGRQQAGKTFEQELERDHARYFEQNRGTIIRVHGETTISKGRVRRKKGPVDFIGSCSIAGLGGQCVAFDAKSWSAATYKHDLEQKHQLEQLQDLALTGAHAFLLIRDQELRVAYMVLAGVVFAELIAGRSIQLRRPKKRLGSKKLSVTDYEHAYPMIVEPPELLISQSAVRWNWLDLLEEIQIGARDEEIQP